MRTQLTHKFRVHHPSQWGKQNAKNERSTSSIPNWVFSTKISTPPFVNSVQANINVHLYTTIAHSQIYLNLYFMRIDPDTVVCDMRVFVCIRRKLWGVCSNCCALHVLLKSMQKIHTKEWMQKLEPFCFLWQKQKKRWFVYTLHTNSQIYGNLRYDTTTTFCLSANHWLISAELLLQFMAMSIDYLINLWLDMFWRLSAIDDIHQSWRKSDHNFVSIRQPLD